MIRESLVEALIKSAMSFEDETRKFYLRCMEQAAEEGVRELFGSLAEEELRHRERLAGLLDSDLDALLSDDDEPVPDVMESPAGDSSHTPGDETGVVEVLKTALEHEISSFNFYVMLSRKSVIPALKKAFLFLASREERHVTHLKAMMAELEFGREDREQ